MGSTATPRTTICEYVSEHPNGDLPAWLAAHAEQVRQALLANGAVVFRGYMLDSVAGFQEIRDALFASRTQYVEASTPRSALGDDVYTSTDFPARHEIALHNENSYVDVWPAYLLFGCLAAAETGGATPLADVRGVLQRLPASLVDEFAQRGWMLVRNYGTGFGLDWKVAFGTSRREEVERYCRTADISCQWLPGGRLRTVQVRPALARHPITGEVVWFNHVCFWHSSQLAPGLREPLIEELGIQGLPFNTFYGNGGLIPDEQVSLIASAYATEKLARPWTRGDVMLVDNMLVAHGREPYTGRRQVVVAMGEERRRADCAVGPAYDHRRGH